MLMMIGSRVNITMEGWACAAYYGREVSGIFTTHKAEFEQVAKWRKALYLQISACTIKWLHLHINAAGAAC
jgi:hypothetical protein